MECQYCKNVLRTKSSLNTHQKTAKYCLELRNMLVAEYKCSDCKKMFSTFTNLNRHQKSCSVGEIISSKIVLVEKYKHDNEKYKQEISYLKEQLVEKNAHIRELEGKLENIALKAVSRSTTTKNTQINNYIQNLQPVTDEYLRDNARHLSIDHILKGPEGYAEYALEYPLKDRLICVDYSRRKVKFKNKDGNIITDPEMNNLATKFFNSIKDKNKELILEYGEQLKENFGDEVDTIVKIFDYKSAVDRGSGGNKTEFHHDFVKQMCSKTIKED